MVLVLHSARLDCNHSDSCYRRADSGRVSTRTSHLFRNTFWMYDNHRDRWHTKAAFRDRMAPAALRVRACPSERTSPEGDRKSTRLNSSHVSISYAVFCLKKKKTAIGRCLLCLICLC